MRQIHRNAWALAIGSGVLQVVIFPNPALDFLCWVAFTPLLVALLRARQPELVHLPASLGSKLVPATPLQAFLLAYVSGLIWYAGTCYWVFHVMHLYGGLGAPMAVAILVLFCLYLGLYHGLFGLLMALLAGGRIHSGRRALLFAPFLWVAVELARTRVTGFPWDLLGTAQVNNIPLCGIAAITGVYGVSLEIVLVNAALAAAFVIRREGRLSMLIVALLAAAVLQSGRLVNPPPTPSDHTATLVQQDIPILGPAQWTAEYFDKTLRELSQISLPPQALEKTGKPGPSLMVWPESPSPFYLSDPGFREAVSALARRAGAYLVVGSLGTSNFPVRQGQPEVFNSAAIVAPDGRLIGRYDKIHLVPFGEYLPFPSLFSFAGGLTREVGEFGRGVSRQPFAVGGYKLGVFICYESVFPDEVRQFARDGAQVFVNISNDGWYGEGGAFTQHLDQARMRAIENRRWLLRATNTGVTAAIDPDGRIVARLPRQQRAVLEAPYGVAGGTTFYTRHGDWFAYGCAIISLVALLLRFRSAGTVG